MTNTYKDNSNGITEIRKYDYNGKFIKVDKNDNIHIYNENSHLIQIINKDDQLIKTVKIRQNKNGGETAEDLEYNDKYIFLINGGEIFKYDLNYNYLTSYHFQNAKNHDKKILKDFNNNIYLKHDMLIYQFESNDFVNKFLIDNSSINDIRFLSFLVDGNIIAYNDKIHLFSYDIDKSKINEMKKRFFVSRGLAVDQENKIWLIGHDIKRIDLDGNTMFELKSKKRDRNILYISDLILNNLIIDGKDNIFIIDRRNKALLKYNNNSLEEIKLEQYLGRHGYPCKVKINSKNELFLFYKKNDANMLIKF